MKVKNLFLTGCLALGGSFSASADESNAVAVTNWNLDYVAESTDASAFSEGIPDGWSGYGVFYSTAVSAEGALCDENGVATAASGNTYVIPATGLNTMRVGSSAELTFAEPLATEAVNLLVFCDFDSGASLTAAVKYSDGSESQATTGNVGSWTYENSDGNEAIAGLGSVLTSWSGKISVNEEKNHRLYEMTIPADKFKTAVGVKLIGSVGYDDETIYVIGVNAAKVEGVKKHLEASLAADNLKIKQGETASLIVNYTLTDIEGLTDQLTCNANVNGEAVTVGEIVNDADAKTLTVPVTAVTPGINTVAITVAFGEQSIQLNAQIWVKSTVSADEANCVAISSWAHDVIAENLPAVDFAGQKLDDQGWVLFTDDVHPYGALAGDERLVVANSGNVYKLAPFNSNNATVIAGGESAGFDFASPIFTENVNLLCISAIGNASLEINVAYDDESTSAEAATATVSDWFANEANGSEAVYGLGRLNLQSSEIAGDRKFRLFEVAVPAQRNHKVKSINVSNTTAGTYCTVLGVNAVDKLTSGIDTVEDANGNKIVETVFNLQGQKVQNPANGLYIVRYTDGTCTKMLIK